MKKSEIMSRLILIGVSLSYSSTSFASEQEKAIFDLNHLTSAETVEIMEQDELLEVTVAPTVNKFRRLADKTYTITKNKKNHWSISYKVSILNNKISSAQSATFKTSKGKFSNTSVKRESSIQAVAKGSWSYNAYATPLKVTATIQNKQLIVK